MGAQKKSKFFVFCFSFIPGAGEMYLGFMKMGLSLMLLFAAACFSAVVIQSPAVLFWCIPLWFYSFFHANNLRGLPDAVFYELPDKYLLSLGNDSEQGIRLMEKYKKIIAVILVVFGLSMIWNNWIGLITSYLPAVLARLIENIGYRIAQTAVGAGIIWIGIYMIRGKQKDLREIEQSREWRDS